MTGYQPIRDQYFLVLSVPGFVSQYLPVNDASVEQSKTKKKISIERDDNNFYEDLSNIMILEWAALYMIYVAARHAFI